MHRFSLIAGLAAVLSFSTGSLVSQEVAHWPTSQLEQISERLKSRVNEQKIAVERMGDFNQHHVILVHRQGDGLAELHEGITDFYVVHSGEATLLVGGEVVEPTTLEPGEIRGPLIRGGKTVTLKPGDVVNIPSKTPHQVLVESGKYISYVIVKIRD